MPGYYLVPQARTDLREILHYIAEDSVDAADTSPVEVVCVLGGAQDLESILK